MQRKLITASSALALLAAAFIISPGAASAQQATVCNPVVDSTGDTVQSVLSNTPVVHAGTVPCPVAQVQAPAPTPAPAPAPQQRLEESVYFVFFDFDRANITPAAQDIINTVVADFRRNQAAGVNVVGHTDTSGPADYNQRLSERRAAAVRESLVNSGVPAGVIETRGVGETQPLIATGDGVREPSNRRAEIRFR